MRILMDTEVDAVAIEFEIGQAAYAEKLDADRSVDYSLNPGKPIGVSLHNVSNGVLLDGLPNEEQVGNILKALNVEIR